MKGPQRTACLAKGYNDDKYKWIEVLVLGKKQWKLKHILYISGSRIQECPFEQQQISCHCMTVSVEGSKERCTRGNVCLCPAAADEHQ